MSPKEITPVRLILAFALVIAANACDSQEKPGRHAGEGTTAKRLPPALATTTSESIAKPSVAGKWRMQRGRLADHYRLTEIDGIIGGEADAAGIANRIPVTGTFDGATLRISWAATGPSEISEDGRADYEFTFEGTMEQDTIDGESLLAGRHLAKGAKVPVRQTFKASMRRVVENPMKNP